MFILNFSGKILWKILKVLVSLNEVFNVHVGLIKATIWIFTYTRRLIRFQSAVLLLYDNARPHTAAQQMLENPHWESIGHPSYSLDLAPCDHQMVVTNVWTIEGGSGGEGGRNLRTTFEWRNSCSISCLLDQQLFTILAIKNFQFFG